jgi:DeoR family transcriptional regulator of aga operon
VMDRLFLSVTGIDPERGATMIEPEEAAVFRAMARQAKQVVVVADSSKIGSVGPGIICTPENIGILITDDGISDEAIAAFTARGVKVLAV